MDSQPLESMRPRKELSPARKLPYSTPKLTALGKAADLSREVADAFLVEASSTNQFQFGQLGLRQNA